MSVRVIAGEAGGLRLLVPKGCPVRPTMDRVKAAIFSTLGQIVCGAKVLDLFAGTGALGIEALSRGAASVVFVENNIHAAAAIEENLRRTRLQGQVVRRSVMGFVDAPVGAPFDLIFADPPYAQAPGDPDPGLDLARHQSLPLLLKEGGFFILERLVDDGLPELALWRNTLRRSYGKTEVHYLTHA